MRHILAKRWIWSTKSLFTYYLLDSNCSLISCWVGWTVNKVPEKMFANSHTPPFPEVFNWSYSPFAKLSDLSRLGTGQISFYFRPHRGVARRPIFLLDREVRYQMLIYRCALEGPLSSTDLQQVGLEINTTSLGVLFGNPFPDSL